MVPEDISIEKKIEGIAQNARRMILELACKSKSSHIGPSFSCIDILVAVYFHVLQIDKNVWTKRDIFVLSKAHAAMALYAVLTLRGLLDEELFWGYLQNDGTLPAHLDRFSASPIEISAGSLGHGFNMALGMAQGYKCQGDPRKIVTLIGDGESEEGSIWEGALFASHLGLDNLTAVLDYNNLQCYGRPKELCHYEPVVDKWRAFGWEVYEICGHDFSEILDAFAKPHNGKPKIIIAHTIKGKGVSFMENELKWHYSILTEELKEKALQELG